MEAFEIEAESAAARARSAAASAAAASAAAAAAADDGLQDHFKELKKMPAATRKKELRKEISFVEHLWPLEQLCQHFHTNLEQGLSRTQVMANRSKYGENKLSPPTSLPWWVKYLLHFTDFFSLLLILAATLCFIAYGLDKYHLPENLYVGIVLLVVVFVTATFTYLQEARSEHMMEGFRKLVPTKCHVIREGTALVLDASDLVPGDLVEVVEGDKVPADIRLTSANDLMLDNSALTGESEALERGPQLENDDQGQPITQPLEANNLIFYTTIVVGGSGRGVVIGTGDNTVMGQIAGLAGETRTNDTPLALELQRFVRNISLLAIAMGLLFFCLGLAIGDPFIQTVVFGIGVIVANVPEGLVPAVTACLALAAQRMHRKNVLVKSLQSVETLGSCTVIASDKTGTLTQNRMTVQHCWYDLRTFSCPLARNRVEWEAIMRGPAAAEAYEAQSLSFQKLQLIATLCNNAQFSAPGMDLGIEIRRPEFDLLSVPCTGDASEQGLLKFVEPIRAAQELRSLYPKLFEIKFTSQNKWQLSIHVQSAQGRLPPVLVMKGAPERVLQRCSYILVNGQVYDLNSETKRKFSEAYEQLGGYGERVLGMAYHDLEGFTNDFKFASKPQPNFPTDGLTFVGMVGMIDPARPGVTDAVAQCKRARVKVIMVTGDHPTTARSIAEKVGILDAAKIADGTAAVVTGDMLREWSALSPRDEALKWDEALSHDQLVFARVSPTHKLLLVEHCQRRGEIVAVTGDGVNDAPALKRADIGIAMGISGKDVSKEAADMILMDDNFASIVSGVEEGRLIFDNLKKTICYALTVNIPQLAPFLANVLFSMPLALSTVLMLAICLGTDMLPAISLAYEEKESDIMERPPRDAKKDHLVNWKLIVHAYLLVGVVQAFAGFLAYLAVFNDYGYPPQILPHIGFDFDEVPIICTISASNEPFMCGYGCDSPHYNLGLPSPSNAPGAADPYCYDGCQMPYPNTSLADPFSEFGLQGFKGQGFCNITCASALSVFAGGVLPAACSNQSIASMVGFPQRSGLSKPFAPVGGAYYWAGQPQVMPNVRYQQEVQRYAQTAYFIACVVTQWANLIVCKTRRLSVFQQGMWNPVLNFALLFETLVAAALVYIPFLQTVFGVRPINIVYWFIGVPFALAIFILGELRKLIIRRDPGGWMERWTYW